MPNISGKDRLVVLCGIFPKEAEFVSVFKDPEKNNLDLIKNDDSYILENDSFFYDCHSRPKTGNVISEVENDFPKMLSETFNTLCELNSIKKVHEIEKQQNINCQFIAEPDGVNLFNVNSKIKSDSANHTLWKKLKKVFSTN